MSDTMRRKAADERDARHAALASALRRRILDALRDATEPLDATNIAERFGIHVTTARFHLDQLEAAGLARRQPRRATGRGRPRIGYAAVAETSADEPLRELNAVLVDALAEDRDGARDRAYDAGTRWALAYRSMLAGRPDRDEDETASAPLLQVFERLGFEPEERFQDGERTIALNACPFRDAAVRHPEVVCSAHRGLLDGSLAELGEATSDASLEPFVEPRLCLVRLRGVLAD